MQIFDKPYKFVNYSGTYQLDLQKGEELEALPLVDETLWMATSAPTKHLRIDAKLRDFLDADADGRILSRDIRRALTWARARFINLASFTDAGDTLALERLKTDDPEAEKCRTAARRIVTNLDKPEAGAITLAEVRDHQAYRSKGFRSGDGVIPPDTVDEEAVKTYLQDIIATVGSVPDINGRQGVDTAKLDAFVAAVKALFAWQQQAESETADGMFPLGDKTAAAYDQLIALREVLDRFFRLCRLKALNDMLQRETPVPPSTANLGSDRETIEGAMQEAPLAKPFGDEQLNIEGEINPQHRPALAKFRDDVLQPILGEDWDSKLLSQAQWTEVQQKFALYEAWQKAKSGGDVEKLGPEKLHSYMEADFEAKVREMIAADLEVGKELSAVADLELAILMQRDFLEICNNFVCFHNLYDPQERALFELGYLVIGGRKLNLCVQVDDLNMHSKLAQPSGLLLLYCEITSADASKKFNLVTPVTSMTLGRLGIERRGVFFDLDGNEWDARVIKVIDNPVSLWDAIMKPFERLIKAIGGAFEKIVGGTEKQLEASVGKSMTEVQTSVQTGVQKAPEASQAKAATPATPVPADQTPQPAPSSKGGIQAFLVGGGVAIAALGSSFAYIANTLKGFGWQNLLIILLVGLGVILIPTVLLAWSKLRRRNLGALLEAGGWAINAEMRLSRRLAKLLSPKPEPPAGFDRVRRDLVSRFLREQQDEQGKPGT